MPALAAWTAFLLCRHVTNAVWPSLVGGYLFGFSAYVLGGTLAHVQTTAVFVLPLIALVLLAVLRGRTRGPRARNPARSTARGTGAPRDGDPSSRRRSAVAVALVLIAIFVPSKRPRLVSLAVPLAGAFILAGVLVSPLLYYLLTGASAGSPPDNDAFVGDSLNFVVPTHVEAVGWWADRLGDHFPANDAERGTYIGVPALVIVFLFARMRWRTGSGRFLLVAFALGVIATLGSWLTFDGRRLISLPWVHLSARPFFEDLMPVRFSLYTALVTAVIVAIWLAATAAGAWVRIGLPVLAVLALVPNVGLAEWAGPEARTLFAASPPTIPALFTGRGYRDCLQKNEVVLATAVRRPWQLAHLAGEERVLVPAGGRLRAEHGPAFLPAATRRRERRVQRGARSDHDRGCPRVRAQGVRLEHRPQRGAEPGVAQDPRSTRPPANGRRRSDLPTRSRLVAFASRLVRRRALCLS